MSSAQHPRGSGRLPLYVSLGMHLLVAAMFVTAGIRLHPKVTSTPGEYQIAMVQVAGGSALARAPLFMAPHGERKADTPQPDRRLSAHPAQGKKAAPKASGSEAQAARPQDQGRSTAAGNGSDAQNATFAFPTFSPRPPVTDRNLLPATDRQVVLDVKLNASGEVVDETLVTAMGNDLDQIALTTVKTWRFQPATLNGQAIASEAEVIFTFGPHYPTGA
jgi:TonB family protein